MKKGEAFMKILKCQNDICYLNVNGQDKKILEITKEDILRALEYSYSNDDIELEEYDKDKIKNEAERIIYENLYNKIQDFIDNKQTLKNEIDGLFRELEEKYEIN